jgi:autotransporter-associated beta strand protein
MTNCYPRIGRLLIACAALLLASAAQAQVTFNITYDANSGFNDNTVDGGETLSRGQLRRNTVNAAIAYMQTVYDGRGSVNFHWNAQDTAAGGFLASFGPNGFAGISGSFQNGQAYQNLRTGNAPFGGDDGDGQFDFTSYGWNYVGANNNTGSRYDMFSVALHEMSHGMGFLTGTRTNMSNQFLGQGLMLSTPGTPDIYSGLDSFVQRGNGTGVQQFNTNVASSGYGSFTGNLSTFTNGNDPTTGLFFGGQYAREVYGSPVPLYAPGTYAQGSSVSHSVTNPAGVMNASISAGTERRAYRDYEIAMLLDMGYNVYNWNGSTTASWSGGNVNNLAASPWRTNMGIVYDGSQIYNVNSNQGQAPILAPYGQVTSNIVLNFAGTSTYTTTNDLGTLRMSRINLNSTAGSASTITGGTFLMGRNSDNTYSVLAPKVVQQNSGAFNIGSTIDIADNVRGLTVDGPGTGTVSFTGNLIGAGGVTKSGSFTMVMGGANNSYSGATVVNQGTLRINGAKTGTGAVTINNGGRIDGSGSIAGAVALNAGAVLAPGNSPGNITFSGGLTMNAGVYEWELASLTTAGAGTNYDVITLNGGSSVFGGTSSLQLNFALLGAGLDPNGANAFWQTGREWQIVSLFSGTFSGNIAGISNANWTSGTFSLASLANGIFLRFAPVPEPSTFALLFATGAIWIVVRRKTKRAVEV